MLCTETLQLSTRKMVTLETKRYTHVIFPYGEDGYTLETAYRNVKTGMSVKKTANNLL